LRGFLLSVLLGLFLASVATSARTDNLGLIVRDGSLGAGSGQVVASGVDPSVGPGGGSANYLITADLGEQRGGNLFHSFLFFGVGPNEIAQFTAAGTEALIDNIVVRVTGGEVSTIGGLLRSSIENADLYFLNPNGIVITESGGIDANQGVWVGAISQSFKGASVFLSTADELAFEASGTGSAGSFRVSDLQAPWSTPDCCASAPDAFVFAGASIAEGVTPASIQVESQYPRMGRYFGTGVDEGQTFYAAAGVVRVTASALAAKGGRVALAAVGNAPVRVPLALSLFDSSLEGLGEEARVELGAFEGGNGTRIETADGGGSKSGRIVLRGGSLVLKNSELWTAGAGAPGIDIDAGVDIRMLQAKAHDFSAEDDAGGITMAAERLELNGNSFLTSVAGDINIDIRGGMTVSGASVIKTASNRSDASLKRVGNIYLQAASLDLLEGGQILSTVEGEEGMRPAVGNVEVEVVGAVRIAGLEALNPVVPQEELQHSSIQVRSLSGTEVEELPGGILLTAESLEVSEGGRISTSTSSVAPAGSIEIHANSSIRVVGGEGPLAAVNAYGGVNGKSGNGGDVWLDAPSIEILDGAAVTATTQGTGNAGNVIIEADTLRVGGEIVRGEASQPSGVYSQAGVREDSGSGGDVELILQELLSLNAGGEISVRTRGSGDAGDVSVKIVQGSLELRGGASIRAAQDSTDASGEAGSIDIEVGGDVLLVDSSLTTQSPATAGGNITIDAQGRVELVRGSSIATDVGETGTGGDIVIRGKLDPDGNPLPSRFVLLGSSDITATALKGSGGNIDIAAAAYLASADSVVDASSELGIDGVVELNAPVVEVAGRLDPLPASFLDVSALLRDHCASRRSAGASSFTVEGRTGLPPAPDDYLPSSLSRVRDAGTAGSAKPRDHAALLPLRAQLADFDPGCGSREPGLAAGG